MLHYRSQAATAQRCRRQAAKKPSLHNRDAHHQRGALWHLCDTITDRLHCKDCRDPNINSCDATSKSCLIVSVECPEGSYTPDDFNPEGPVRCFPEKPSTSIPKELGEAVRRLCIPKAVHEPSLLTALTTFRSTARAKNARLLANKKHA